VLPFSAALAGRLLGGQILGGRRLAGRLKAARLVSLLLAVVLLGYLAGLARELTQPAAEAQNQQLTSWLVARHLHSGLSGYWESNVVTLTSGDRVQIRAVAPSDGGDRPGVGGPTRPPVHRGPPTQPADRPEPVAKALGSAKDARDSGHSHTPMALATMQACPDARCSRRARRRRRDARIPRHLAILLALRSPLSPSSGGKAPERKAIAIHQTSAADVGRPR
jgi:hypothetical protein